MWTFDKCLVTSLITSHDVLIRRWEGPARAEGGYQVGKVGGDAACAASGASASGGLARHGRLSGWCAYWGGSGIVNGVVDFGRHPQVINGCSGLFVEVLAITAGMPAVDRDGHPTKRDPRDRGDCPSLVSSPQSGKPGVSLAIGIYPWNGLDVGVDVLVEDLEGRLGLDSMRAF